MGHKWYVKVKLWVCKALGHPLTSGQPWEYNGHKHRVCKVCHFVVSEKQGGAE